ncbi:CBASS oligonucleotide cyclase [Wenyingzhuangia sp. IMCC45574]
MGGSGGSFDSYSSPSDSANRIREAEKESLDKAYESDVNTVLNDVLKGLNNRPVEEINSHIETLTKALNSDIEGVVDLFFGGSVEKHTYVNGLSDVDSLVVLNNSELSNKSPKEVLDYFADKLRNRLPNTEITIGKLAVTVKYSNGVEVQLLPSVKTETGYKIASPNKENEWSKVVKPRKFAEKLTSVNKANANKVVPVIKLVKSIISSLPEARRMSGYHTESMAIEIFKNYSGQQQTKAMLNHFFSEASKKVLTPIKDSTGQSRHVDSYLEKSNSTKRRMVADSLSQLSRKINNLDAKKNKESWKELFK